MVRVLVILALAITTMVVGMPPAGAADKPCTRGDVQALANAGASIARRHFGGFSGSDPWPACQFRLYDDNDVDDDPGDAVDTEVAHVFSEDDYVLAGVFFFELADALDRPEYDRAAAIESLQTLGVRLFWGPAGAADADLVEIPLTPTPYKGGQATLGVVIYTHYYAIFAPGSLAPGEYRFRAEFTDPLFGDSASYGEVVILAA